MRTEKLDGAPEISASGAGFGFRKRLDGGYTVANLNASVSEIVPDSFRLARDFLPLWRSGQARVQVRLERPLHGGGAHAAALVARTSRRRSRRCASWIRNRSRG